MFYGLFELLELKLIEDIILLFGTKNIVFSHNFDQFLRCPKDDSKLPAKKKTFETNISKVFLETASISIFFLRYKIK